MVGTAYQEVRATARDRLISFSTPWVESSLVAFLKNAHGVPRVYWIAPNDRLGFAGYGVTAVLTASGPKRFQTIQTKARDLFDGYIPFIPDGPAELRPRLFGGFSFNEETDPRSIWHAFSAAYFILPRYLLTRFEGGLWLTINHLLRPDDDLGEIIWLFTEKIDEFRKLPLKRPDISTDSISHDPSAQPSIDLLLEPEVWNQNIHRATETIRQGSLEKVVLARALRYCSSSPIDPALPLLELARKYPDCHRFLFEPLSGHAFFGATPEILLELAGQDLRSVALAGSIRRGETPELDLALERELFENAKERHEHRLVVDAIVRNLKPYLKSIEVSSQPGIRKLSNIQHLETPIRGTTRDKQGILPLVQALHPTPAVGGSPRRQAVRLIERSEPFHRGWYASPVGWFDQHEDGLFTVAIRSALNTKNETRLFAGAGIVADSVPENEWRETGLKFLPVLDALQGLHHG